MGNIVNTLHDAKLLGIIKHKLDMMEGREAGRSEAEVADLVLDLMRKQIWVVVLDNKACQCILQKDSTVELHSSWKGKRLYCWPFCQFHLCKCRLGKYSRREMQKGRPGVVRG